MKTILLILALSFATGGYAQNKNCISGHKHKGKQSHKVVSRTKNRMRYNNAAPAIMERTAVATPTCLTYRKHNIVVTECPDIFYDSNGKASFIDNSSAIEYQTESAYTGGYPSAQPVQHNEQQQQAPQIKSDNRPATEIDNGTFNNLCLWGCPSK
jgi:hypothetical protein